MKTSKETLCPLAQNTCVPCKGGVEPLTPERIAPLKKQLHAEWQVIDGRRLERKFKVKDFKAALDLTNKIGALAEEQGHHPDIQLGWGRVIVTLYTHKIEGLHENDFILAARIDRL